MSSLERTRHLLRSEEMPTAGLADSPPHYPGGYFSWLRKGLVPSAIAHYLNPTFIHGLRDRALNTANGVSHATNLAAGAERSRTAPKLYDREQSRRRET